MSRRKKSKGQFIDYSSALFAMALASGLVAMLTIVAALLTWEIAVF
jgi:hypothetical protein